MIDYDEQKLNKLFHVFEDKLTSIASSTGYNGQNVDSPEYRKLERAWDHYVGSLGIERLGKSDTYFILDHRLFIWDPFGIGEQLLMTEETAEKILTLGLP